MWKALEMVIISRAFWYFDQNVYYLHIHIEKCVCSVYNVIKGGKYETKRSCEKTQKCRISPCQTWRRP